MPHLEPRLTDIQLHIRTAAATATATATATTTGTLTATATATATIIATDGPMHHQAWTQSKLVSN